MFDLVIHSEKQRIGGATMIGWTRILFPWLCLLSTVTCFSIEGVDDSILFKFRWNEPLGSVKYAPGGEDFETVRLMSADKEPFVCYVPRKLQVEGDDTNVRNYQGPTPYELLEPLFANKVCRYKLDSYWTYQLCHGRSLRQYHEDTIASKVAIMEFYLGKSDEETRKRDHETYKRELQEKLKATLERLPPKPSDADSEKTDSEKAESDSDESTEQPSLTPMIKLDGVDYPSFVMNMSYGTLCDINGKPRFTQVHYICDELSDHDLYSFEETSTCIYKVIVRTPLLCKHPMYRVGATPENEISCHRAENESTESAGKPDLGESTLQSDDNEIDENLPRRLQEMERENRDFRRSSAVESEGGDSDFKRNLKIFFLQDEDEERKEPPQHGAKNILRVLNGETCLTGGSGWWRYEFCYGKRVTQYHLEKGERTQEILLGKWDEAKHRRWVNANSFRKVPPNPTYVKHFYTDGELCAVTGKPRTVVVKLECKAVSGQADAVSISLQEPKACEYKLSVESSIVCNLLANVDEDGLPELLSPVNGHRSKTQTTEAEENRNEDAPPSPVAEA